MHLFPAVLAYFVYSFPENFAVIIVILQLLSQRNYLSNVTRIFVCYLYQCLFASQPNKSCTFPLSLSLNQQIPIDYQKTATINIA